MNIGLFKVPENSHFSFWAFVFKPAHPDPDGRRPANNTAITHEWMVSEQHGRDPLLFGLPVLADPGRLSQDRLMAYFIA
ncbi:MAG TPA: hypothetical protein VM783_04935, partial [Candidatus Acidoferrum sp.]|nr:hypothetical protein [Candidatus Acidoferrum sp.]